MGAEMAIAAGMAGATGGMSLLTSGIITALSGLLSSIPGLFGGDSDAEKTIKEALESLTQNEAWIKSPAFSKEELFNNIFPQISGMFRGAANVAAGQAGAKIGEISSGMGGGQNAAELYMQALAPIIAEGEINSAKSLQGLIELYATMDDASKRRFLSTVQLKMGGVENLDSMNPYEKAFLNFVSGANLGATALGNIGKASTDEGTTWADLLGLVNNKPSTGNSASVNKLRFSGNNEGLG